MRPGEREQAHRPAAYWSRPVPAVPNGRRPTNAFGPRAHTSTQAPAPFSASRVVFFPLPVPIPTGTGRSRSRARPPRTAAASFAGRLRCGSTDAPSYSRAASPLGHLLISVRHDFSPSFSSAVRFPGDAVLSTLRPRLTASFVFLVLRRPYVPAAEWLWGAAPLSSSASAMAVAATASAPALAFACGYLLAARQCAGPREEAETDHRVINCTVSSPFAKTLESY